MTAMSQLTRWTRSARTWITLGVLAPIGMMIVSAVMLADLRVEAWNKADQTSTNLVQVLKRDIERNVEIIDLSLSAIIENLNAPGISDVTPELRQLVLFDHAATAQDLGAMFVLDENGDITVDSRAVPPRRQNYADRDYFIKHKLSADLGLHISGPLVSRLTGTKMIALSRRINKPDGSFGGIVLATLNLSYFNRLCDRIGLGRDGVIGLFLRDGTRILRFPPTNANVGVNLGQAPGFQQFVRETRGSIVTVSASDGIKRLFAFTRVGDLPLILDVGLATYEIERAWRTKALVVGAIVLVLCGLTSGLSLLFGKELRRRAAMEAQLALLSLTDALTGLANRRRFEDAFEPACKNARRTRQPLSLLVVDADHFKRYNDIYGHAVGDQVLKDLAACLAASVKRPGDLVCRTGGEEFAVLLPDTDQVGAMRVAKQIHESVANVSVAASGIRAGSLTVSIGLATETSDSDSIRTQSLYQLADAALYEAKAGGRNRTCHAGSNDGEDETRAGAVNAASE